MSSDATDCRSADDDNARWAMAAQRLPKFAVPNGHQGVVWRYRSAMAWAASKLSSPGPSRTDRWWNVLTSSAATGFAGSLDREPSPGTAHPLALLFASEEFRHWVTVDAPTDVSPKAGLPSNAAAAFSAPAISSGSGPHPCADNRR
jgi:hypothetical protein